MQFGPISTKLLGKGLWLFNEPVDGRPQTDAYLIAGQERALVIDALTEDRGLFAEVKKLCDLPLAVAVTHGHPDHAGSALKDFNEAGCEIFMHESDLSILKPGIDAAWFKPLVKGQVFDLGRRSIEVFPLPGHTPGSMILLDRENQLAFTGDAIGAGVFWMHIPGALPLSSFLHNLESFCNEVAGWENLAIHTGHAHQAPQHKREFLDEVLALTKDIVSGRVIGEDKVMNFGPHKIEYKTVGRKLMSDYCYNPNNI